MNATQKQQGARSESNSLYRLPWSATNNPNGWVEVTTHCQLRCPKCYRGVGEDGWRPAHRHADEVKTEIDTLVRCRNIQTVSFSGGEPLLYPHLEEIVTYARQRGLETMLVTNGVGLDLARIERLRDCGVRRIVVHVDKHQGRVSPVTEEAVNTLRQQYCELFRRTKGVTLGFMFPVTPDTFGDLPVVVEFCKANADVVRVVGFTVVGEPRPGSEVTEGRIVHSDVLFDRIAELYGLEYAAYLPRSRSGGHAWRIAYGVFRQGRALGWVDGEVCRDVEEDNLRREGRYLYISNRVRWSWRLLWAMARNSSVRTLLAKVIRTAGPRHAGRLSLNMVFVVNTPEKLADGTWDVCGGCPDAILWNGKLVPSCLLERAKAGEATPVLGTVGELVREERRDITLGTEVRRELKLGFQGNG